MQVKILCGATLIAASSIALCAGSAAARQAAAASSSNSASGATSAPQDSLAEAARKAKAAKAQAGASGKTAKVFTNDNLPTDSVISTVGTTPSSEASATGDTGDKKSAGSSSGSGEKAWRDKFAALHKKLDQDQSELDVMQREMGQLNLQNYNDPVKAMQQGYSRGDIQQKTNDIDAKKKEVAADQQAISDAEDEMRKAGGDAGWSSK